MIVIPQHSMLDIISFKISLGSRKITALLTAMTCSAVFGCAPEFKSEYVFTPPSDKSNEGCLGKASNTHKKCVELEKKRSHDCEARRGTADEPCRYQLHLGGSRRVEWDPCDPKACLVDTTQCDVDFRREYEVCGGTIQVRRLCIAHCDSPQSKK